MTECPSMNDYRQAVQQPAVFTTTGLKQAMFEPYPVFGVPIPASGTTAVVFKATVSGQEEALRFFTREDASSRDRYAAIGPYIKAAGLTANVAKADWVDDAIRIGGRSWPDGADAMGRGAHPGRVRRAPGGRRRRACDRRFGRHLARPGAADADRTLRPRRSPARQRPHRHPRDTAACRPRLCVWITDFAGKSAPTERGHRNYQRPDASWGPRMHTFPGLVIYLCCSRSRATRCRGRPSTTATTSLPPVRTSIRRSGRTPGYIWPRCANRCWTGWPPNSRKSTRHHHGARRCHRTVRPHPSRVRGRRARPAPGRGGTHLSPAGGQLPGPPDRRAPNGSGRQPH